MYTYKMAVLKTIIVRKPEQLPKVGTGIILGLNLRKKLSVKNKKSK